MNEKTIKDMSNVELDKMYQSLTRSSNVNLTPTAELIQKEMESRFHNFSSKGKDTAPTGDEGEE